MYPKSASAIVGVGLLDDPAVRCCEYLYLATKS